MSRSSSKFDKVRCDHPVASELFVFLRHTCPPELMSDDGYVRVKYISQYLGFDITTIGYAVTKYNYQTTRHRGISIDDDGEGHLLMKANTCHSVKKIMMERYYPSFSDQGHIHINKNFKYKEGDDTGVFARGVIPGNCTTLVY